MPIFEFICNGCKKRFSLLVGVVADSSEARCPKCGGRDLKKLISRVAVVRSEEEVLESLADPSKIGDLEDPRAMKHWMKRISKEMGEDLGEELEEYMQEAEKAGGEEGAEGAEPNYEEGI